MNLFYNLPRDIRLYIFSLVKIISANVIIKSWKRYLYFKKFIFDTTYKSPTYFSILDGELMFDVSHSFTSFYFKILTNITTGNESYFHSIYLLLFSFSIFFVDY